MSRSYKTTLETLFHDCFPAEWCIATLQTLNEVWQESRAHCRSGKFGPEEGRDLLSHYCRSRFETELRRLSNKFPGIKGESRPNSRATYNHTFIESSKLVLTASAVPLPTSRPRRAEFRDVYNANGQLELFKSFEEIQEEMEKVYAFILYGPPQANVPSFLNIAFPCKNSNRFVESIPLVQRYPGIISTPVLEEIHIPAPVIQPPQAAPEEKIKKDKKPSIRRLPKRAGEEES